MIEHLVTVALPALPNPDDIENRSGWRDVPPGGRPREEHLGAQASKLPVWSGAARRRSSCAVAAESPWRPASPAAP